MGYVDQNLIQGEKVTYRAPLHWKVLIGPLFVALMLLVAAIAAFKHAWSEAANSRVFEIAGAVLLGIAAAAVIKVWITVSSAEFAVTNRRVILKTGFIHNKTAEMFLSKVESVGVDQTLLGRIFGYGSIELRGTGGSLEPFSNISRPLEFRRQIQEQIGQGLEQRS